MKIFVGNLSPQVNESDLETEFTKFGKVTSVKIIKDMFTQQSKGFGFVEMQGNTEAKAAMDKLNTAEIKGKRIVVNEARPPRNNRNSSKGRRY